MFSDFALRDLSETWIGFDAGSSKDVRPQQPSMTSRCPDVKALQRVEKGRIGSSLSLSPLGITFRDVIMLKITFYWSTSHSRGRKYDQTGPHQPYKVWISWWLQQFSNAIYLTG
jgi:hypothetical protein